MSCASVRDGGGDYERHGASVFQRRRRLVSSDDNATVSRAALLADLLPILQPDHSKQYFVILGEKGVGKSTAVRQTVRARREPRGVIYVMAPSSSSYDAVPPAAPATSL